MIFTGFGPAINSAEQRANPGRITQTEKNPAPFLAPLGQPGIDKDFDMARHTGLALTENLGQFTHGQLHRTQKRHDSQSSRVGKRPEDFEFGSHL
jgi:hypothetical protein